MKIEDWYAKNNFCLVMQYFCVCNKFAIGYVTPQYPTSASKLRRIERGREGNEENVWVVGTRVSTNTNY